MQNFGTNNWWINIIKGILALTLGGLIVAKPDTALVVIATYFGLFAILGGIIVLLYAFWNQRNGIKSRFWMVEGSFNILIGLIVVIYPHISVSIFLAFFGIWAVIIGILQLMAFKRYRNLNMHAGTILISAILSLAIGAVLFFNPFESAKVIAVLVGVYALIYGLFTLYTAFKMLNNKDQVKS